MTDRHNTADVIALDRRLPALDGLQAEFARLEVLLRIVQRHRDDKQASAEQKRDLSEAQCAVDAARAKGVWQSLLPGGLAAEPLVPDVLALALFPYARPSAVLALTALQQGVSGAAPCQALVHELLMLGPREEAALNLLISPAHELLALGAIRTEGVGPLRQIHPGAAILRRVFGEEGFGNLPAGIRLISTAQRPLPDLLISAEMTERLAEIEALACLAEEAPSDAGGPAVLFVGAPGTGKSLAARHLAKRLGRPLFQLDLGAIVSKWVGETERNLSRVFEQMAGTEGCILIDEADALLGKRVNVKEGRDHYVNITVSHLLMLLENHRGLVFLTSNLRANLDDAYTRRFAAVVEFKRPDAELRTRLWQGVLDRHSVEGDIPELVRLAGSIDLSAAEIANAGRLAVALARLDGGPITAGTLARAVLREKTKVTATFARTDLRMLAPYLETQK